MADFLTTIGDWLGLNKGNATIAGADSNRGILDTLQGQGTPLLDKNAANAEALRKLFMGGAQSYADATGVNGAAGNTRATNAFHAGPGYQFAQDQGIQALMRTASARGDIGGGELPIDLAKYVTGTADQAWQQHIADLNPYNGLALQGTGMAAGATGDKLQFLEDLASGRISANNMQASGEEAGQGKAWDLLGNVAGVAGAAFGLNKKPGGYTPGFGGYGSF